MKYLHVPFIFCLILDQYQTSAALAIRLETFSFLDKYCQLFLSHIFFLLQIRSLASKRLNQASYPLLCKGPQATQSIILEKQY